MWVLRVKHWSSEKPSALNCWAFSSPYVKIFNSPFRPIVPLLSVFSLGHHNYAYYSAHEFLLNHTHALGLWWKQQGPHHYKLNSDVLLLGMRVFYFCWLKQQGLLSSMNDLGFFSTLSGSQIRADCWFFSFLFQSFFSYHCLISFFYTVL